MTDGPQTYWELVDDIDTKVEEVIGDIVDKANWAAQKLEDAANGIGAFFGDLFGDSEAKKAVDKWNNELQPEIQSGVNKISSEVMNAVGDLVGNPKALIDYSEALIAAKGTLYTSNTLDQDITSLGHTWEGDAYESYKTVATEQSNALLALSNNLQKGGELTSAGADKILQLWLDLAQHFVDYSSQAISIIGSLADVGKALGAWISTIADAIALIWQKVCDVAITLGTFWKDQITKDSMNWEIISAGFDGMPENHWPMISESSSDTMNDPENWPEAS